MKICYVIPEYDNPDSSRYFYIIEFLEILAKYEDVLLFVETPGSAKLNFPVYYQKIKLPPFNLIERLIVFSFLRIQGTQLFYVHYSIFSSLICSIITRLTGGKSLYWFCQMRNLYSHALWEETLFKLNLKLISKLITCTNQMVEYWASVYKVPKSKISTIPLWINSKRFEKAKKNEQEFRKEFGLKNEPVVLFVHWLSKRKGAEKIIPIYKLLSRNIKDIQFFVIGDGPFFEEIKKYKSPSVKLFGKIGNHEIAKYYAVASVFLMPSKEEEFGRVLLEAMATEVPIVSTKTSGPEAVMTDLQKKYLVEPNDLKDFSVKISEILDDKHLSKSLQKEGKLVAKNYEIEKVVQEFLAVTKR